MGWQDRGVSDKLPDLLFDLLLIQNGGMAIVIDSPILPLLPPTNPHYFQLTNLTSAAGKTVPCSFEELTWIAGDFGNPDLIVPLEPSPHFHGLNYTSDGPQSEPAVVYIDIASGHGEHVSDSFTEWALHCIDKNGSK